MLDGILEIFVDIISEVIFGKVDNSKTPKPARLLILTGIVAAMLALFVFCAFTAYNEGSAGMAGILLVVALLVVIWWIYRCYKIIIHK